MSAIITTHGRKMVESWKAAELEKDQLARGIGWGETNGKG
jgi:hypothetical protein